MRPVDLKERKVIMRGRGPPHTKKISLLLSSWKCRNPPSSFASLLLQYQYTISVEGLF
jgi:hypothetical protein